MKKKIISIVTIVLVLAVMAGCMSTLAGCSKVFKKGLEEKADLSEIKIGLITLHDKNSTYDKNFIVAMEEVQAKLDLKANQVLIASGIPEGDECYQKACELADQGCNIIIADSFGHGDYMIKAAKKYPTVLFAHATGTKAHTEKDLDNFVNAFASIYEGRYLAGVVAGMKLKELVAAGKSPVVGYIGAYTYAEVMSGYTSWFLGVRSIVPEATMKVTFTGSWYDETKEKNAAENLINKEGCVLISQHADSMGAPNACEKAGVPNVSYNGSTAEQCPNTFLISSRINWAPYYEYLIKCRQEGTKPMKDYVGTIATDSVQVTDLGKSVAAGTKEKLAEVKTQLVAGTLKVFDTNNFTVTDYDKDGKVVKASYKLTSYKADVDDTVGADGKSDYIHETEVIADGYFQESKFRSAPYFDVEIDGITLLDRNYGD